MNTLMQNLFELQSLEFDDAVQSNTEKRIAELRAAIPQVVLAHYDRYGDRGKRPVAAVRFRVCGGCHMRVPIGVVLELKHGNDVRLCDSCGRYLYYESNISEAMPERPTKGGKKPIAHAT